MRALAYLSLLLIIAGMVLSEMEMEVQSIACNLVAFIPLALYCYKLDKHERRTE